MEVTGEDFVEREWDDELEGKLKRAWDLSDAHEDHGLRGDPRGHRGRPAGADAAAARLLRLLRVEPDRRGPRGDGPRRDRRRRRTRPSCSSPPTTTARWSGSRSTSGSGRACAAPGSSCWTTCSSPRAPAAPGHADALIEAVADVARRHGAPIISWFTMPDNKRAHTVYDRVGGTRRDAARVRARALADEHERHRGALGRSPSGSSAGNPSRLMAFSGALVVAQRRGAADPDLTSAPTFERARARPRSSSAAPRTTHEGRRSADRSPSRHPDP